MSYVIASTTDSQEAVNTAAGIGTPQPAATPSEAPAQEPESDGESETPEEEPGQEAEEQAQQKRQESNAQRRINRLTRDKYEALAAKEFAEKQLAAYQQAMQQQRPPQQPQDVPQGEPQESQFERYEDYIRALVQYGNAQMYNAIQREQQQRVQQYQQTQQQAEWQTRVQNYRTEAADFDEVLESVEHIQLSHALQQAILEHEHGPKLAYELAKDPKTLERISRLSPASAVRELGKFEASLNGNTRPPAISKAPPPISPVGQGSARSTKNPEEMSFQEFKRWRLKNGASTR